MATEVVQFRFDPAGLAFLRDHGLNPNEFARAAFASALRGARAREQLIRLRELTGGAGLSEPAEDLVRAMRDERDEELGRRLDPS